MIIPDQNFEELFDIQLDINAELEVKLEKANKELEQYKQVVDELTTEGEEKENSRFYLLNELKKRDELIEVMACSMRQSYNTGRRVTLVDLEAVKVSISKKYEALNKLGEE